MDTFETEQIIVDTLILGPMFARQVSYRQQLQKLISDKGRDEILIMWQWLQGVPETLNSIPKPWKNLYLLVAELLGGLIQQHSAIVMLRQVRQHQEGCQGELRTLRLPAQTHP